jgi:hypothetical protein
MACGKSSASPLAFNCHLLVKIVSSVALPFGQWGYGTGAIPVTSVVEPVFV